MLSHTSFSYDLPNHVQGYPKNGIGEGEFLHSQGILRDSVTSVCLIPDWNLMATQCKLLSLHKEQRHKLQVLCGKGILLRHALGQIILWRHSHLFFFPIRCHAPAWLPAYQQGYSMSQTSEWILIRIATQPKFPQTPTLQWSKSTRECSSRVQCCSCVSKRPCCAR